jgi:hypothetical protein
VPNRLCCVTLVFSEHLSFIFYTRYAKNGRMLGMRDSDRYNERNTHTSVIELQCFSGKEGNRRNKIKMIVQR